MVKLLVLSSTTRYRKAYVEVLIITREAIEQKVSVDLIECQSHGFSQ